MGLLPQTSLGGSASRGPPVATVLLHSVESRSLPPSPLPKNYFEVKKNFFWYWEKFSAAPPPPHTHTRINPEKCCPKVSVRYLLSFLRGLASAGIESDGLMSPTVVSPTKFNIEEVANLDAHNNQVGKPV